MLISNNNDGYTLIEALVALTIVSFGLIAVLGLFNKSLMRYDEAQRITQATIIASNKLQSELSMALPHLVPAVPQEAEAVDNYAIAKSYQGTGVPGIKQITISVSWGDRPEETTSLSAFLPEAK